MINQYDHVSDSVIRNIFLHDGYKSNLILLMQIIRKTIWFILMMHRITLQKLGM